MKSSSVRYLLAATTAFSLILSTAVPANAQNELTNALGSLLGKKKEENPPANATQSGDIETQKKQALEALLTDAKRARRILIRGELLRLDAYRLLLDAEAIYQQALLAYQLAAETQKQLASGTKRVTADRENFVKALRAVQLAHAAQSEVLRKATVAINDFAKSEPSDLSKIGEKGNEFMFEPAVAPPTAMSDESLKALRTDFDTTRDAAIQSVSLVAGEMKKQKGGSETFLREIYYPTTTNMKKAEITLETCQRNLEQAKAQLDAMTATSDKIQKDLLIETGKVVGVLALHGVAIKKLFDVADDSKGAKKWTAYIGAAAAVTSALNVINKYTNLLNAHGEKSKATIALLQNYRTNINASTASFSQADTVIKGMITTLDSNAKTMFVKS